MTGGTHPKVQEAQLTLCLPLSLSVRVLLRDSEVLGQLTHFPITFCQLNVPLSVSESLRGVEGRKGLGEWKSQAFSHFNPRIPLTILFKDRT